MSSTTAAQRRTLVLCLALVYLIWGGSYIATSIGVHALPPFAFGAVRFIIGGVLLFSIARWRNNSVPVTRKDWRNAAVVAVGTVLVSNGCNVWGMQWVPANQSALLNATQAFWIPLLGMFGARGHPLVPRVAIGLLIGFAGTALIIWPHDDAAGRALTQASGGLLPQIVILLGCLGWAAGTLAIRNFQSKHDVLTLTSLQLFCGGLMLGTVALFTNEFARWHWSWAGFGAMLYLLIFSSCIAYAAYAWLAQHASPAQTGTTSLVNPAVAAVLGWLILGEQLTRAQLLGMLVILLGLTLVNWPQARVARVEPPAVTGSG